MMAGSPSVATNIFKVPKKDHLPSLPKTSLNSSKKDHIPSLPKTSSKSSKKSSSKSSNSSKNDHLLCLPKTSSKCNFTYGVPSVPCNWTASVQCPVCGMVFIFCLVRHVVGGWPLFLCFAFYPAPCNWVASVHIVPSVPCNWAAINPRTRPRVHNYYTRPSSPWPGWHMCWKIIHSMSTRVFLKCPNANTNETYIPVENFQTQH